MSARMIMAPSPPQPAEGEAIGLELRAPGTAATDLLSAHPEADDLFSRNDSGKLLDDLLRQFSMADPSPWRHGGLNE